MKPETRTRDLADGSREWSLPVEAWVKTKTPRRLFVVAENGLYVGLLSIADEPVTSVAATAERCGDGPEVTLSIQEARWLFSVLPGAILRAEELKASRREVEE